MIPSGSTVLVGFSGGPDSVCLLSVLCHLQTVLPFRLRAVHVNHGIRGEEASRDAEFAAAFCRDRGISFSLHAVDVPEISADSGESLEEAGRRIRYQIFEEEADRADRENGRCTTRIAVAHHRDDSAETILMNLFRGTGLAGLSGIPPVRGRVIRPLIDTGREEILAYLERNSLPCVTDSTNADTAYTRNYVRRVLLPGAAAHVNARAAEHTVFAGDKIREADLFLRKLADSWCRDHAMKTEGGIRADARAYVREDRILREYILRNLLAMSGCPAKDVAASHIAMADDIALGHAGRSADLPYGFRVIREYEAVVITCGEEETTAGTFASRVFMRKDCVNFPIQQYTKWFDYDKIQYKLSFRFRQPGDYLMIRDGRKSLHRFMIDEHIPAEKRGRIPVVADGNHVLWVVGYRISEYYKLSGSTRRVLEISYTGGTKSGG